MVALRGLVIWLGATTAMAHCLRTKVGPAGSLSRMPEPTGHHGLSEVLSEQQTKQISIASAAATAVKWQGIELLRRQSSQNETSTSPPSTPPSTRTSSPSSETTGSRRPTSSISSSSKTPSSTTPSSSRSSASSTSPPKTSSSKPSSPKSSSPKPSSPKPSSPKPSSPKTSSPTTASSHSRISSSSSRENGKTPAPTKPISKTVVRTTTLPNGQTRTYTHVVVITPTGEAAQASNTEKAPSLQTGAADSMYGKLAGREVMALAGCVFGVACLL